MSVSFVLDGLEFQALNGGPEFTFTEAISLFVTAETQDEIDDLWEKLTSGGGEPRTVRLAQGQVRPLMADRPAHPGRAPG